MCIIIISINLLLFLCFLLTPYCSILVQLSGLVQSVVGMYPRQCGQNGVF